MQITTRKNITDQEKIDWLRLSRSQNIGRSTMFRLLELFGNVKDAIRNVEQYSLKGGRERPIILCTQQQAEKEFELSTKFGAQIIICEDEAYPKLLREIPDLPPLITVKGNADLLHRNIIAIVGPRNASFNGCKFAKQIAHDLTNRNFVISSGLARGIDSAAHDGSIEKGTIAVIGGGINNIYPKENTNLYHQIAEQGLLVSEFPFGMLPYSGSFPQRNRIISGISLGVAVIEATTRSGTLITARLALEQNREVFAVPGSPFDPRCEGTNQLIKEGAKLLQNVNDIIEELPIIDERGVRFMEPKSADFAGFSVKAPSEDDTDKVRNLILSKISYSPITVDEIISELQISARIVNVALLQLELADKISNQNGKICLI